MRLWSIHPIYLDAKGLVALWREGLLAQAVLQGKTTGYKNHPQLTRFRNSTNPVGAIAAYLKHVADEADRRGYNFDRGKLGIPGPHGPIFVTSGQVVYEFHHLLDKLEKRSPARFAQLRKIKTIKVHPILKKVDGEVEQWEKQSPKPQLL